MKTLYANSREESIFIKLKTFCEKKGITFKYVAPYIYKENGLAEKRWQTIIIIKDLLLLDSGLLLDFWAKTIDIVNYFQNRLFTKSQTGELIFEKEWTD